MLNNTKKAIYITILLIALVMLLSVLGIQRTYFKNNSFSETLHLIYLNSVIKIFPSKTWKWQSLKENLLLDCKATISETYRPDQKISAALILNLLATSKKTEMEKIATIRLDSPKKSTSSKQVCTIFAIKEGNKNKISYTSEQGHAKNIFVNDGIYGEMPGVKLPQDQQLEVGSQGN